MVNRPGATRKPALRSCPAPAILLGEEQHPLLSRTCQQPRHNTSVSLQPLPLFSGNFFSFRLYKNQRPYCGFPSLLPNPYNSCLLNPNICLKLQGAGTLGRTTTDQCHPVCVVTRHGGRLWATHFSCPSVLLCIPWGLLLLLLVREESGLGIKMRSKGFGIRRSGSVLHALAQQSLPLLKPPFVHHHYQMGRCSETNFLR